MKNINIIVLTLLSLFGTLAKNSFAKESDEIQKQVLLEKSKIAIGFKQNIRSGMTYKPISYTSLSPIEKTVINKALSIYIPHMVSCNGTDYVQYKNTSKVYEVRDYGTKMLFDTVSLSKAEKLNGLTWRGSIHVTVGGGAYREIKIDGSYGKWMDRSDFRSEQEIPSLNSYSGLYIGNSVMKDGKLYWYDIDSMAVHQIGNEITLGGKDFKPLTCTQIKNGQRNIPEEPKIKEIKLVDSEEVGWLLPPKVKVIDAYLAYEPRRVKVLIEADKQGNVTNVEIVQSSDLPVLDAEVIKAVKLAKFKPYVKNGQYSPIKITLPFDFSPQEQPKHSASSNEVKRDVRFSRPPKLNITAHDLENENRSVMVLVETNKFGNIINTTIRKSSGLSALDEKIIRATRLAKYEPYIENGEYYPIRAEIPFNLSP